MEITLNKHINTKHTESEKLCKFKCSLCEDKFQTSAELADHIEDHLQEIRELDISKLRNGQKVFKCNVCQYQSSNDEEVRKHLISHTKVSLTAIEKKLLKPTANRKSEYNIMDRYGDDGRPIDDDSDANISLSDDDS